MGNFRFTYVITVLVVQRNFGFIPYYIRRPPIHWRFLWLYDITYIWIFFPTNSLTYFIWMSLVFFTNLELTFRYHLTSSTGSITWGRGMLACSWCQLFLISWMLSLQWVLFLWEKCPNGKTSALYMWDKNGSSPSTNICT